ncbi:transforming growth factor-beta receptor-associated protein 1 homolog [Esox lucius]|uniref:CNH domain-containing protein n=1 Tax=Esox lucius TaxID=8010 RepID=A0A3P9AQK1_ESOLU|nr:transforming growth factor-beta receptor-associated protein 1 homolog [Esox lucius]XP_010885013.1 transforming growth factor-beta receptor-associated protein 1 homolog [Esox lucius]XP_010885014.1 transforming growth factor-beta receptor-associated protein 1 homolog [Esox lucius]XP_010885015.1 transforming growth factor-beta receptor-associated protein 1 homolog [Esox lucius]XP_010885016.1 transforming growth factor-beta receptor-associated protein 1 homolog [Esox lucius]XP_010885017.1 trans
MSVKAFELVPAVDREQLMGDKARISIECIECCGKHLYVGTNDCFIHHFLLEEHTTTKGTLSYSVQKLLVMYLGQKKPVEALKAASALERLIVLCDATLSMVDMVTLEAVPSGGAKVKGVAAFCVNENPVIGDPFCVEIGVISARKRAVQVYMVYEDRVQLVKEVNTPQQPCAVSLDGYFLCLALSSQYMILNYSTGAAQDLFPYDSEERKPIVKRIGREEFLLAAPGGLGMFANAEGMSQRAPVNWSESVIGAAVCFPYVVALDEGFITIHSMLDQQLKQTLSFRDGHILQDFEGKVVLASTKAVYVLVPLPLERQVQDLLAGHRVEEALTLTEGARRNIPKDRFQVLYKRILQQAGFIQFGQLQFLEAEEHFRKGQLDVRELISLYPLLLPSSSSFTRCHPPLHQFADLNHLAQGDQEKVQRCKRFLISYLGEVRSTEGANGCREDVDTALLKLYAEQDHESLLDLLASPNACLLADSAPWLEKHHKYFALGLLYHYNGQDAAAVQLWVRVVNGELQDSTRTDLYEYIVDFLSFCSNLDLVWKYADWALQRDQTIGVQIFTKRPVGKNQSKDQPCQVNPDDVVTYLGKHSQALLLYLEHLVLEKQIQREQFHTQLALLYTDRVLSALNQSPGLEAQLVVARDKLQFLLRESSLYRVHLLLGKIQPCDQLLLEQATLHGKLEEHDKALHILVYQLKNFPAAEDYCVWGSASQGPAYRQHLYHLLLGVYLDLDAPGRGAGAGGGELEVAAVDLLNRHGELFDAVRVLDLIPEGWSLELLRPFLVRALRGTMHARRTSQVSLGLARSENLQLQHDRLKQRGGPVLLSDKKGCHLCHNTFTGPDCVCLPGGRPVHTHCAAERVVRDSPAKRRLANASNHT